VPLPLDVENDISEEFYERRNQESSFPGVYYYPAWVGIQLACRCPWLWRRLLATPRVLRLAAPLLSTSDSLCTRCAALCASPAPDRLWRTTRLPTATCLESSIPLWLALIQNIQRFLYLLVTYSVYIHVGKGLPTYCVTRVVGRQPLAAKDKQRSRLAGYGASKSQPKHQVCWCMQLTRPATSGFSSN